MIPGHERLVHQSRDKGIVIRLPTVQREKVVLDIPHVGFLGPEEEITPFGPIEPFPKDLDVLRRRFGDLAKSVVLKHRAILYRRGLAVSCCCG